MTSKLIVALDFSSQEQALALIEQIDPDSCALKIGSEMFTLFGTDFVRGLVRRGYKLFLDLKFHDIPNTVAHACRSAAELGVWMINVHASGGLNMMKAARAALDPYGAKRPLLIAVTVLTSMDSSELPQIGVDASVLQQVSRLAHLSHQAGLDGVVCSAYEVEFIKSQLGSQFLTVTPGIRLSGESRDDQSRIMTPTEAARLGSDYLVVGRPITRAPQPATVINAILQSIR
ncbi:MAG: orotidine-5'-phosphate decarboxylase [Legionella sp.]|nr:orotidine-5'-phosphate decarboxylase [Legionella sp.]